MALEWPFYCVWATTLSHPWDHTRNHASAGETLIQERSMTCKAFTTTLGRWNRFRNRNCDLFWLITDVTRSCAWWRWINDHVHLTKELLKTSRRFHCKRETFEGEFLKTRFFKCGATLKTFKVPRKERFKLINVSRETLPLSSWTSYQETLSNENNDFAGCDRKFKLSEKSSLVKCTLKVLLWNLKNIIDWLLNEIIKWIENLFATLNGSQRC